MHSEIKRNGVMMLGEYLWDFYILFELSEKDLVFVK